MYCFQLCFKKPYLILYDRMLLSEETYTKSIIEKAKEAAANAKRQKVAVQQSEPVKTNANKHLLS